MTSNALPAPAAFYMTVTQADGTVSEGICTEAQAARSLATAARRGYRVEATRNGGAVIVRDIRGSVVPRKHTVTLEPVAPTGKVTPAMRADLDAIAKRRAGAWLVRGRINAGFYSIPPASAARLVQRGLVTVEGTAVAVSIAARLAMLAQDHHTETGEPRGYHREVGVIGPWRKGGCVYDRSSVAHCACRWSYPAEDRDSARRKAHEHRQEATAALLATLEADR